MTTPVAWPIVLVLLLGSSAVLRAAPVGSEFQVNTYTTSFQRNPAVASDAAGNFVVVWDSSEGQDGSDSGVFGQTLRERRGLRWVPSFR